MHVRMLYAILYVFGCDAGVRACVCAFVCVCERVYACTVGVHLLVYMRVGLYVRERVCACEVIGTNTLDRMQA